MADARCSRIQNLSSEYQPLVMVKVCPGKTTYDLAAVINQMKGFGLLEVRSVTDQLNVLVVPDRAGGEATEVLIANAMKKGTVLLMLEEDFIAACRRLDELLILKKTIPKNSLRNSGHWLEDEEDSEQSPPICPAFDTAEARRDTIKKFCDHVRSVARTKIVPNALTGKRIFITGKFKRFQTHGDFATYLRACGARKIDNKNVSKDTDYVIKGAGRIYKENINKFQKFQANSEKSSNLQVFDEIKFFDFLKERKVNKQRTREHPATATTKEVDAELTADCDVGPSNDEIWCKEDIDGIEAAVKKRCLSFVGYCIRVGVKGKQLQLERKRQAIMKKRVTAAIRLTLEEDMPKESDDDQVEHENLHFEREDEEGIDDDLHREREDFERVDQSLRGHDVDDRHEQLSNEEHPRIHECTSVYSISGTGSDIEEGECTCDY